MTQTLARRLDWALVVVLLLFGVYEVFTHRDDTAGALAFWSISLVGGGGLVWAGLITIPRRRRLGLTMLTIGALSGINATLWTLVVPLLAIAAVVTSFRASAATKRA
jgi:hypothetical protein